MMQVTWRALLVVVLLLLTSVGTASAQCAWVLWYRTAPSMLVPNAPFDPRLAYPTEHACQDAMQRDATGIEAIARTDPEYTVSRGPNFVTVQGEGKRVVKLHVWRCLPDTVDRAGRRGSSRIDHG
jgi:hypothetical protein